MPNQQYDFVILPSNPSKTSQEIPSRLNDKQTSNCPMYWCLLPLLHLPSSSMRMKTIDAAIYQCGLALPWPQSRVSCLLLELLGTYSVRLWSLLLCQSVWVRSRSISWIHSQHQLSHHWTHQQGLNVDHTTWWTSLATLLSSWLHNLTLVFPIKSPWWPSHAGAHCSQKSILQYYHYVPCHRTWK